MKKKSAPSTGTTHAERVRRERGVDKRDDDLLTPAEMLDSLRRDVIAIGRGAEMQIRELTVIATDYARGKIDAREANKRYFEYSDHWCDPLYGISSFEGKTDQQILQEMAEVRRQLRSSWTTSEERTESTKGKGRPR